MKDKNFLWNITMDDYMEAVELAQKNGVKAGESMEKYLLQVMKKKNKKPLASTNLDIDILTGELREDGLKVLNMSELNRKKKKDK